MTEFQRELQKTLNFIVNHGHDDEFREGSGLPYAYHPIAVQTMIFDWGIDCLITNKAALTHDVVESKDLRIMPDLIEVVGFVTSQVVRELTFIPTIDMDKPVHEQKREYIASFSSKSVRALVVKLADRICNVLDFCKTKPDYAHKYLKKGQPLMDILKSREEEVKAAFGELVPARIIDSWDKAVAASLAA